MSGWLSNVRTRVAGRVQKGNDASFFPMLLQSKSESSEGEAEYGNSMLLPAGGSGDRKDLTTVYKFHQEHQTCQILKG